MWLTMDAGGRQRLIFMLSVSPAGWRAGRDGDWEWRCGAGGRGVEPSGASQQLGADHSAAHCMHEHE